MINLKFRTAATAPRASRARVQWIFVERKALNLAVPRIRGPAKDPAKCILDSGICTGLRQQF